MLSDRSKYHGGNILVRKDSNQGHEHDGYDDEDEDEGEGHTGTDAHTTPSRDLSQPADATAATKKPRFSALSTKIGRFTPDKGGLMLLQSDSEHGIHKLTRGKVEMLVIELWPFQDAAIGTRRATIEEARPIKAKDEL
jgi:hypothetical protein